MPSPVAAAVLLLVAQVGTPSQPSPAAANFAAEPTLAPPPSRITIAGEAPEPTLADGHAADPIVAVSGGSAPSGATGNLQTIEPTPLQPVAELKPADLLESLAAPPAGPQSLEGTPTRLAEVLVGAPTRREQTERTIAYWDLAAAAMEYRLAEREAAELVALRQEVAQPGVAWDDAERRLDVRTRLAQQGVVDAQERLRALLGQDASSPAILAADAPHGGQYACRYAEIFAGRVDPSAERLSKSIELRHQELVAESRAVAEALGWLDAVRSRAGSLSGDGAELLRAHELTSLRLQQFVAAARQYNREIAAYAELAAPANVETERLVAMLIRTTEPGESATLHRDEQVALAGAVEAFNNPPAPSLAEESAAVDRQPEQRNGLFGGRLREVRRPIVDRLLDREHSIIRRRAPRTN